MYPIGGRPSNTFPSRNPVTEPSTSATSRGHAWRVPRTAKNAYTPSNEARAIRSMAGASRSSAARTLIRPTNSRGSDNLAVPSDIGQCRLGVIGLLARLPDLFLHLQQDRQEHRRHGVELGRVAPRARVEAGLVHQLVEHLAVLLPEGAAVVHPVVEDRLRVEAVRRHGAAHGNSPPSEDPHGL